MTILVSNAWRVATAGVALKVMRMFKCRLIEGQYWLEADMRLQCYTSEWAGYVVDSSIVCLSVASAWWTTSG